MEVPDELVVTAGRVRVIGELPNDTDGGAPPSAPVVSTGALVARNAILNLASQGLPLIVGLVTLPRVINGLGAARYGVLTLAWTLLGYLSVFDFGLSRATTKFVAELTARGDTESVPRIAWTTIAMQCALGSIGGVLLALFARPLAYHILNVPADLAPEAESCFLVLALAVPIVLLSNSLRGLLEAAQRFDLVNAVRAPSNTLYYLLPFAGVLLKVSLPSILMAFVVSWIIGVIVQLQMCGRVYPAFLRRPQFIRREARRLLHFGGWATVSGLISPMLVYADRVIIGSLLTVAAVSYYAAPFDMVTRLLVIPSSLVGTLFPALSALSGAEGDRTMARLLARTSKFLLLVLGPIILVLVIFAHPLLRLWLGASFAEKSSLPLRLLAVGVLSNALAQIPFSLAQARGRPDIPARFHLVELPIHIVAIAVGVRYWGIAGAAAAWSARVTLDCVLLYGAAMRLSAATWEDFRTDRLPSVVAILAVAGAAMSLGRVEAVPMPMRIGAVVLGATAGIGSLWVFALSQPERTALLRIGRRSNS
ncbi:MAG: flippase [bacterium]